MATKKSGTRLETEIERCRCECQWDKIPELVKQLSAKLIANDDMAELLLAECKLEIFLKEHPLKPESVPCSPRQKLVEVRKHLTAALDRGNLKTDFMLEASLTMAKLNYVEGNFREAINIYTKVGLDELPLVAIPPYRLRMFAEAFSTKGLCLEKLSSSSSTGNLNVDRDQEIIMCYEKAGDIALLYLQDMERVLISNLQNRSPKPGPMAHDQELGFFLETGLQRAHVLYFKNGKLLFQDTISSHPKICHPQTNIMFLKTHKTASSTVMNIMYRFTEKHNLSIALPVDRSNLFKYPLPFQAKYVEGFLGEKTGQFYNIICNHMRFNLPEVQKVVPNTTIYLSILRNPVSVLESSYSYFHHITSFQKTKTLDEFLASPQSFYNRNEINHMLTRNTMWYDFGYDNNAEDTDSYVQSVLREIEQRFQLVLIAEYFDESMVLLKHTLCWDMEDVVSFKQNSRSKDSVQDLSEKSKEKAKEWCSLDWKLYQHFNRTFWRRIHETIGEEHLEKELKLLRSKQEDFRDQCLQEGEAIGKEQIKDPKMQPFQPAVAHILGYNLKQGLGSDLHKVCHRMVIPEHHYCTLMNKYQFS